MQYHITAANTKTKKDKLDEKPLLMVSSTTRYNEET